MPMSFIANQGLLALDKTHLPEEVRKALVFRVKEEDTVIVQGDVIPTTSGHNAYLVAAVLEDKLLVRANHSGQIFTLSETVVSLPLIVPRFAAAFTLDLQQHFYAIREAAKDAIEQCFQAI